jgi:hypothetical protein
MSGRGWVRGLPLKTQRTRFEWGTNNHAIRKSEGFERATCVSTVSHKRHPNNESGRHHLNLAHKSVPRGACPACLKPIDRKKMKVSKEFPCPHCHQLVRTSAPFRIFMSLFAIGLATVAVFRNGLPLAANVVLWIAWWFLFTFLYIWMASIVRRPQLELFRERKGIQKRKKDDGVQSLGLRR